MTWPGEVTTSLGFELKGLARFYGYNNPMFLGLTGGYMTYFTNEEEFLEGRYEACNSLYGPKGAKRIIKGHDEMLFDSLVGTNTP